MTFYECYSVRRDSCHLIHKTRRELEVPLSDRALDTGDENPVDEVRDVEEAESQLDDQYGNDPVGFWEAKQRDLVTSAVDYNLFSLSSLVRAKKIDLSPKYQRRNRWTNVRKSQLIESFLMNVPVPPIFLNEDEYGRYSVIDGKQRLTAINDFLVGRLRLTGLEVFSELNGSSIDELPGTLQTILETRAAIRAIIILRQSDSDVKYQVFQRLNTGGIRLNPQEIRNSAWPGNLNEMILEESSSDLFHKALGIADRHKSELYKEMRDAEFVLRYLSFKDDWETFKGGMGRRLDDFMVNNHSMPISQVEELRSAFRESVRKSMAAFGEYAYRRWMPEKQTWRKPVLAAAFDAEIFAVQDFDISKLELNQDALITGVKELFSDPTFRSAIDSATNTPSYFRERIRLVRHTIASIVS
ncbi:DUF262 domain-containing protein [Micromonospora sp. RL09-050-HVF-A]|uniref:DUF262 domain-containing protein n=1 Tax=Micromonospora sp. RL09-050-HVF-A TaxID=1703433 RepID=UPI001C5EB46C|nr:DUF262 domain-containing protein [Micromonospora sp. RL09-050-HVF-A]MBW4704049.1 DUF262 domain-containing protein [Micromonospora sp. RL09-050-HVF-A]